MPLSIFSFKGRVSTAERIWILAGKILLFLITLDILLGVFIYVKDINVLDSRHKADVYKDHKEIAEYYREKRQSDKTHWKSYVHWSFDEFDGKYIKINANGVRYTKNFCDGKKDSVYRIFTFGGSAMWGVGDSDENTIASHLSKCLYDKGLLVEVSNFGVAGWITTQGVIELICQLQHGNVPDMVIFYDGDNNVWSGYQNGKAGLPVQQQHRRDEFNLLNPAQGRRSPEVVLTHVFPNIKRVYLSAARRFGVGGGCAVAELNEDLSRQILSVYANNCKIVSSLGEAYGFKSLFYWQPVLFYKDKLSEWEKKRIKDAEFMRPQFDQVYGMVDDYMSKFTEVRFFNISNIFKHTEEPIYIDNSHMSGVGNKIIAGRMAEDVEKIIQSDQAN